MTWFQRLCKAAPGLIIALTLAPAAANQEPGNIIDPASRINNAYAGYVERLLKHQSALMQDAESKLAQQEWQTTAIAIVVLVMVLSGLVLAALQFYADYKSRGKSAIHFKIGSGSFEFKSAVIGLAILLFSMWFFHLYIDRVYSIQSITVPPVTLGAPQASASNAEEGIAHVLPSNSNTQPQK